MTKNICFNGCSFTVGEGFNPEDRDAYVYDRLVANDLKLNRTNIAKGGSSNYLIFMRSAEAIISNQYDIVVTQWSALNRLWLFPGPDTGFFVNATPKNYVYRDISINKKEHEKLKNQLLMLNHDYPNILELIKYCRILESLCSIKKNKTKCIFVNGLVPWTKDLFEYKKWVDNFQEYKLSNYAKEILDFDYRDDKEIICFLEDLNNAYKEVVEDKWVNIFESFDNVTVDRGLLGHHPGIESNKIFANMLKEFIINKNLIEKA